MTTIVATISSKNQITVPAEVRRLLGVGSHDKLLFVVTDAGAIEVRRPRFTLDDIIGSLEPLAGASLDFRAEIEAATAEEMDRVTNDRARP